jgi:hypothetical protein
VTEPRRTKILSIAAEVFVDLLLTIQKGEWIGVDGIPEDIRILNAAYDLQMMQFKVLVESKEWDVVHPNSASPEWSPTLHKYSTQGWSPDHPQEAEVGNPHSWIMVDKRIGIELVGPLEKITMPVTAHAYRFAPGGDVMIDHSCGDCGREKFDPIHTDSLPCRHGNMRGDCSTCRDNRAAHF